MLDGARCCERAGFGAEVLAQFLLVPCSELADDREGVSDMRVAIERVFARRALAVKEASNG